jgi:alkylated DNA repair dioxygenase AlkB
MSLAVQASLLDLADEVRLGALTGRVQRTPLALGAWVDHRPGWVEGSDVVLDSLLRDIPWRAERRRMYDRVVAVPRLVAWYDADARLPHPVLTSARAALSAFYRPELGEPFTTAGCCLYRDGRDSVAWHGDTIGRSATEDTLVAIVSFGAPRSLLLRPRSGGPSRSFRLGHGDLLVMGGSCQRTWEHAVPKTAQHVGPRVSVQLRPHGVA